jgi:peptidoglycan hydrolase-like protein with peptidoglycan-binding domain
VLAILLAGCTTALSSGPPAADPVGSQGSTSTTGSTAASTSTSTSTSSTSTSTSTSTSSTSTTTTTTTTVPTAKSFLQLGSTGPYVLALQRRLSALGYWLGADNGVFGDSTQQAVYALQKAAGIQRDGIAGPQTKAALAKGVVPVPLAASGNVIEVDLEDDLVMFVDGGKLMATLNCSTGGGYTFSTGDGTTTAITPEGVFHTFRVIDGLDTDSLGSLWRPRFFSGPFAIHGDSYVPPYPVSHGCVRVSDEAIDWIWAENLDPIGMEVWVY